MSTYKNKFLAPDTSHYDDCRSMLQSIMTHHKVRIAIAFALCLISVIVHSMNTFTDGTIFGVIAGMLSFPFAAAVLGISFAAKPDNMKILIALLITLAAGTLFNLIQPGIGVALILIFATQILESRRLDWLKQQEGYPHFEQYITIQEYGLEEYEPTHEICEKQHGGSMPELDETAMDPLNIPADLRKNTVPRPAAKPAPHTGMQDIAAVSAGILAEPAKPEQPAPEKKKRRSGAWKKLAQEQAASTVPDLPTVDFDVPKDIPDPVWDIPDPVMDTSVITSVPEIAGDIADLPDIPDIPTL